MRISLARILDELREDHRNLARLLDVLENECRDIPEEGEPDMDLLHDIMHYMTVYPDAVHHPKEDVVYAELRMQRPDLADGLDHVPDDHRDIAILGSQLRGEVEAINAGAAVRREQMIEDTTAYVECLRRHMAWEESEFFSRIDRMMDAEPRKIDVAAFEHIRDPVFELEIEAGFRRLIRSIAGKR